METERSRISDIITLTEIEKWQDGDTVIISAGTDTGKSYFIKNVLYKKARRDNKKILMLINRTACREQFQTEIKLARKSGTIEIKTYQYVETLLKHQKTAELYEYKYIVCDEFHYFLSDSSFNSFTELSFNAVFNQRHSIKIYMSGTGQFMQRKINELLKRQPRKPFLYELPPDYGHINSLTFYNSEETTIKLAEQFKGSGEKAIFFVQNPQKAYKLYKKYAKNALFLCGQSDRKLYDKIDKEKISTMLCKQRFNEQFLFATTCFDAGANIIDTDLHNIVIDVKDIDSLIQCIGRKRVQNADDTVNLYIRNINNNILGGKLTANKKSLARADYLLTNGAKAYVRKYGNTAEARDDSKIGMIYDASAFSKRHKNACTKKVNQMIYSKRKYDNKRIETILAEGGFVKYIANILYFGSQYDRRYGFIDESFQFSITEHLEMLNKSGLVMLNKEAKEKNLINMLDLKDKFHKCRRLQTIKTINAVFEEWKVPYRVESFITHRNIDGKRVKFKAAWRIIKME